MRIFHLFLVCLLAGCHGLAAAEPLRTVAAIRALPDDPSSNCLPVSIKGVILYSDKKTGDMVIHDGADSCYFFIQHAPPFPDVGDLVQADGVTVTFGLFAHFNSYSTTKLGKGDLPPPRRLDADDIYEPRLDSAWIEVPAMVTGVQSGGLAYTLVVDVFGQPFKADVPLVPDAAARAATLMQRPVMMRAILGTVHNDRRQMVGRHFFVPSFDDLIPTAPAADSSGAPLIAVTGLLKGNSGPKSLVRVEGVVIQDDRKGFYLRDKSASIYVQTAMTEPLPPGTRVTVEGFGAISPFMPLLRATRVVRTTAGPPPEPVPLKFQTDNASRWHMEFVTLDADCLGQRDVQDETIIQFRSAGQVFDAILPHEDGLNRKFIAGDRVRLTGICELTTTHPLPRPYWVDGFHIRLANSGQMILLRRGPWWTTERLLSALGVMTTLAVLGVFGTLFFRRIVRKQALSISEKLSDAAVSRDRYRIARDIHDDLGANLNQIALLSELAQEDLGKPTAASEHLNKIFNTSKGLARKLDETVWAINPAHDSLDAIVAFLGNFAQEHFRLAGIRCRFDVPEILPELTLNSAVRHNFFLAAKEALQNVVKHSAASEAWLRVHREEGDLVLSIEDNGKGTADDSAASANPTANKGNGLENMRLRMEGIGGRFEFESKPGKGTTVRLVLSGVLKG